MRIGDAAQLSGVSARMLRYYDKLGLVVPSGRSAAGYREYSKSDLRRLFRVEALRALGLTLVQTREVLNSVSGTPDHLIAELIAQSRARISQEQELLTRLERLDATSPQSWDDALRAVRLARGLKSPRAVERQRAALEVGSEEKDHVSALVAALLREEDPNAAGSLQWAIIRTAPGPEALSAVLGSPSVEVRGRAIRSIAAFHGAHATELLIQALKDPASELRTEAAVALAKRGEQVAIPELIAAIIAGRRDVEAAEGLGSLASVHESASILAQLQGHLEAAETPPAARSRLTQALGEIPGAERRSLLEQLAADNDRTVARVAGYLLTL